MRKLVIWSSNWRGYHFKLWYRATYCLWRFKSIAQNFLVRRKLCWVKDSLNQKLFDRLYYDWIYNLVYTCGVSSMLLTESCSYKWNSTSPIRVYSLHWDIWKSLYVYSWWVYKDKWFGSFSLRRFHLCRNLWRISVSGCRFTSNFLWSSNTRVFSLFSRHWSYRSKDNLCEWKICRS